MPSGEDRLVVDDGRCHEVFGDVGFPALGVPDRVVGPIRVCVSK